MTDAESVLSFWFGDDLSTLDAILARCIVWFARDPSFDEQIRVRFGDLPTHAEQGHLDTWQDDARSSLALVLVLDQFPRNLHRDSNRCFAYDPIAHRVALDAIDRGFDAELAPVEASFLYLPFEHAEDIESQRRSVVLFEQLLDRVPEEMRPHFESTLSFARRHHEVIKRFGRFPHRNALLGRSSTDEELNYLESGGETFDGSG